MSTEFLASLIAAVVTFAGVMLTNRQQRRATDHKRITDLESRVDKLERNQGVLVAYAQELRDHIYRQEPPPPPPWPELA